MISKRFFFHKGSWNTRNFQFIQFSPLLNDPPRMDRKEISRRILDFTLEIIYLLSGEDYTVVKKTSMDCVTPIIYYHDSGGLPSLPLIHDQKILELAHKIIELLAGEVPIRCQDVAVYFSLEEWEYIEKHKDLYKDDMMETHRPLTSPDGSRRRNPPERCPRPLYSPERCPRPLYSQDCPEEKLPENHQVDGADIKPEVKDEEEEEEMDLWTDQQYESSRRNHSERCPRPLYFQDWSKENFSENHRVDGADIKHEVKDEAEEEMDLWTDQQYESSRRNHAERCPRPPYFQDCPEEKLPENHQNNSLLPHTLLMSKQKRLSYKIPFKLEVVKYAKEHGNRAAERRFGPPPTEKMIREWRKLESQLQKADKTKRSFRGHAANWPQLEMEMKEWIVHHRNNGCPVSTQMIICEAKRIAAETGLEDFTGSASWCYRFMKRSGLAMRTKSRTAQKLPAEHESFHKFVIDARRKHGFETGQIGAMDKVPLTFDISLNRTLGSNGLKSTTVKNSGPERAHYTVVLSCCADGTKLPPMLIIKRKNMPKDQIPQGIIMHLHDKGWMDEDGMKVWIEKVWSKRPGGLLKKSALLVLDQFRAHTSETTQERFKELKTHLAVVPGELTSKLQPLDVSINKPFQVSMQIEWNKWMAAGNPGLTPTRKRPTISQVCGWVKTSWQSVTDETIIRSFKKCGISNALDGSEDYMLYEDGEESDGNECDQLSLRSSDSGDEFMGFAEGRRPQD